MLTALITGPRWSEAPMTGAGQCGVPGTGPASTQSPGTSRTSQARIPSIIQPRDVKMTFLSLRSGQPGVSQGGGEGWSDHRHGGQEGAGDREAAHQDHGDHGGQRGEDRDCGWRSGGPECSRDTQVRKYYDSVIVVFMTNIL